MRRAFLPFAIAALLVTLLPASVSADPVIRFAERHVGAFCESPIDGGVVAAGIDSSSAFGSFASAEVWLDPAIPFEDPPTAGGTTETIDVTEGPTEIVLHATFLVFDADGNEAGEADLTLTMTPDGDPEPVGTSPKGNHHSATTGFTQRLEGTGTLSILGLDIALPQCVGDLSDVVVVETNPRSFVSTNAGVVLDCFWESDTEAASLFVIEDGFGLFADVIYSTMEGELLAIGRNSGSVDASGMSVTISLEDPVTGEPGSAIAEATFTPLGAPVTSVLIGSHSRNRVTEQVLDPDGSLDFSNGASFPIGDEDCNSLAFDNHGRTAVAAGPKPGPAPANDTPDGAVAVVLGSRLNAQTGGAANEPEVPITTCPEGPFDAMGRTVWYAFEGTGDPITLDTSGSSFDTLVGVYTLDGEDFVEVACIDDVELDPVGGSFQAVLTLDTEAGVTYYAQVGGFQPFFGGDPQSGRLRLRVS